MRRTSQLFISICALFLSQFALAACPYPEDVMVPDGATATSEDMVNGQTRIKQYMAEMEAYLDCLDQEQADLDRDPTQDELTLHNQRRNSAIDQMRTRALQWGDRRMSM